MPAGAQLAVAVPAELPILINEGFCLFVLLFFGFFLNVPL